MRAIIFVASALLVSGCATAPQSPVSVCPPVKACSQSEQDALAVAIAALPPDSPLIGAMLDYGRLRAAARACAKA